MFLLVVGPAGGIRKAKRVSDVAAMGAPSPSPAFSPAPAYNTGYVPAGPPPPYQEGIQLDTSQDFGAPAAPTGSKYILAYYVYFHCKLAKHTDYTLLRD